MKDDIGDAERIAAFVQLAMNEAREESEQKCATLRARVAELEAALREVEWGDHDEMEEACCPSCASHAFRGYHQTGCRLAAALAPRSERREGEPAVTVESMYAAYGAPAAPKEEE